MITKIKQTKRNLSYDNSFNCLNNRNVIEAKISDHHPMTHHGILFWNVMMQGKKKSSQGNSDSYNNGFGMIETNELYQKRLASIAHVIAEIIKSDPTIQIISLCEGPILENDIKVLITTLQKQASMKNFFSNHTEFHSPKITSHPNWGLLMLAKNPYQIRKINFELDDNHKLFNKLANRIQLWEIVQDEKPMYMGLAHFPFGDNEFVTEKNKLSIQGHAYREFINALLNKFENKKFIFCADFNFNPYLLSEYQDRHLDNIPNNNSLILKQQDKASPSVQNVTVDGILLSTKAKQIYFSSQPQLGLFGKLSREYHFAATHAQDKKNKHWRTESQAIHDQHCGLIPQKRINR